MACALLPAGVAAVLPSPRRSAAASKGQRSQVACTNQLHWKQPLSGSSTGAAMSRSVDAVSFHADVSLRDPVDAVLGAQIVISGYWIGPEVEDGCGHVHAILQRIG
uniref:Uncharacterized protein n=1 Tax=Aegilops tauschii TaxID=37682 RepID=M8D9G9_AEGTA